jgi:hypothetical protein
MSCAARQSAVRALGSFERDTGTRARSERACPPPRDRRAKSSTRSAEDVRLRQASGGVVGLTKRVLTPLRKPDISMTFISMTLLAGCERTGPMRTGTAAAPKEPRSV